MIWTRIETHHEMLRIVLLSVNVQQLKLYTCANFTSLLQPWQSCHRTARGENGYCCASEVFVIRLVLAARLVSRKAVLMLTWKDCRLSVLRAPLTERVPSAKSTHTVSPLYTGHVNQVSLWVCEQEVDMIGGRRRRRWKKKRNTGADKRRCAVRITRTGLVQFFLNCLCVY